jgi:hypothetical protein
MTIVTADGSHLTVNEYSYPDLFWALRGGGGGTYGVLTSVTYRSHPNTPFSSVSFEAILTDQNNTNPNATQNMLAELIRMTPTLNDQGYGGYSMFTRSFVFFCFASPNVTWTQTNQTFQPFFDYAVKQAKIGGLSIRNSTVSFPSFESMYASLTTQVTAVIGTLVGLRMDLSSWLLPYSTITSNPNALASVLIDLPSFVYLYVPSLPCHLTAL